MLSLKRLRNLGNTDEVGGKSGWRNKLSSHLSFGEFWEETVDMMTKHGLLLCSVGADGKPNVMAIGGLKPVPAQKVRVPIIDQGVIHYECVVVHKNDVLPEFLAKEIAESAYPQGNFHRIYFGEIVAAYADPEGVKRLR